MDRRITSPAWQTQNFLHQRSLVDRLLRMAAIGPQDLVLDLGAGRGIITEALAQRCRRVIAVENDPGLAAGLRRRFADQLNVVVCEDDALRMRLPRQPYTVFANIPFDGTARLIHCGSPGSKQRSSTASCAPTSTPAPVSTWCSSDCSSAGRR